MTACGKKSRYTPDTRNYLKNQAWVPSGEAKCTTGKSTPMSRTSNSPTPATSKDQGLPSTPPRKGVFYKVKIKTREGY